MEEMNRVTRERMLEGQRRFIVCLPPKSEQRSVGTWPADRLATQGYRTGLWTGSDQGTLRNDGAGNRGRTRPGSLSCAAPKKNWSAT